MGWASSSDAVQGTHVKFDSKEDAIHFAEKQGMSIRSIRRLLTSQVGTTLYKNHMSRCSAESHIPTTFCTRPES